MSSIPFPDIFTSRNRKNLRNLSLALAGVVLLTSGVALRKTIFGGEKAFEGTFQPVLKMDLDVKVSKDGELQAVNNIDIISQVEGSNTIIRLVPEGTTVKKGDLLVQMDASQIEQKIDDTTLDVQKAEADLATANQMKLIQQSQNDANLEAAQLALQLARIDLQQYTEGTYPQSLVNAQTDVDTAQVTLKNRQEDFEQTQRMYDKGFMTAANVKTAELDVSNAMVALRKAQTALDVLTQYTNAMSLATKKTTVVQAEAKLYRVQRENAAAMAQQMQSIKAREETLNSVNRKLAKLKEQQAACTITAPAEGLVLYASTLDRWSSTQIQEGATVRERQLLLRLPDTGAMKAVIRVPEAQVPRLQIGQRAQVRVVGMAKPLEATLTKISVLSDSSSRWNNPDLKEYPVDLTFDQTPPHLKPGMGAMCEVYIDRLQGVTAVPLTSIYSAGKDAYVFVRAGLSVRPVKVALGKVNETHAQIVSGVELGQEVLVLQAGQGRELLEKAGIKVVEAAPTTKPSARSGGKHKPELPAPPKA